jgi:CIC family chloride channel protein
MGQTTSSPVTTNSILPFRKRVAVLWDRLKNYRHTDYSLLIIAALLGIAIGGAIVLFHEAMEAAEHFFADIFFSTDEVLHVGRFAFPLVTALGGLLVGILNDKLFSQIPGEDLHTIVHALERHKGKVHWGHSVRSIVTAAFSIASGGGGGREGPTIMLGSSLGSSIGQAFRVNENSLKILCAAGAAAAISGIFNAPLAGIIFALEAIVGGLMLTHFIPIVIASVLATATSRILIGSNPAIMAPAIESPHLWQYAIIALVGVLSGLTAIYYIKVYCFTTTTILRLLKPVPKIWRPAIGGLLAGIIVAALPSMLETSYSPINQAILGQIPLLIALLTVILKPLNNAFTLASGGAGGTFAPSLKVGAMLGALFAVGTSLGLGPINIGFYSIVGAAAVLAGTWRVPLTGAVLLCEISHNYDFLLPLLLATVLAVFIVERVKSIETFNPLDKSN